MSKQNTAKGYENEGLNTRPLSVTERQVEAASSPPDSTQADNIHLNPQRFFFII